MLCEWSACAMLCGRGRRDVKGWMGRRVLKIVSFGALCFCSCERCWVIYNSIILLELKEPCDGVSRVYIVSGVLSIARRLHVLSEHYQR